MKDFVPHHVPEDPANHACNDEGGYWTSRDKLADFAKRFCTDDHTTGRTLSYRFPGKGMDDMTNAVTETYTIDGVDNTVVRIYGFVDGGSEDCKNRYPNGLDIETDYCIDALLFVIDQC